MTGYLFCNGQIVNEGECFEGNLLVKNGRIVEVFRKNQPLPSDENLVIIDISHKLLMPGMIDTHVHFRTPGLTHKATIFSESRAAAKGGVTSFIDMPNTIPQTINSSLLEEKITTAEKESLINYGFFIGATNHNLQDLLTVDPSICAGVKIYMGSSTGNMLVDKLEMLQNIFQQSQLPIMVHCEDEQIIRQNWEHYKQSDHVLPFNIHALIRNREACLKSTEFAVKLAKKYSTPLHIAHISTAEELGLLSKEDHITGEACIPHLYFTEQDYHLLGNKIKCNPAIKTIEDRTALRLAVENNIITTIATDHAPHLLTEKMSDYFHAPSGIPSIQHAVEISLSLFPPTVVANKTAHEPANLFGIKQRGFIRKGYYADFIIVEKNKQKICATDLLSLCQWSPWEGKNSSYRVEQTWIGGEQVYGNGQIQEKASKQSLLFAHTQHCL